MEKTVKLGKKKKQMLTARSLSPGDSVEIPPRIISESEVRKINCRF